MSDRSIPMRSSPGECVGGGGGGGGMIHLRPVGPDELWGVGGGGGGSVSIGKITTTTFFALKA